VRCDVPSSRKSRAAASDQPCTIADMTETREHQAQPPPRRLRRCSSDVRTAARWVCWPTDSMTTGRPQCLTERCQTPRDAAAGVCVHAVCLRRAIASTVAAAAAASVARCMQQTCCHLRSQSVSLSTVSRVARQTDGQTDDAPTS